MLKPVFSLAGELNFMQVACLSLRLRYRWTAQALSAEIAASVVVPAKAINRIFHQVHQDFSFDSASATLEFRTTLRLEAQGTIFVQIVS